MPKTKHFFHRLKTITSSTVALVALLALASCSKPPQQAAQSPLNVTAAHPQLMTVTNWDEYPGRLDAVQMVEIKPRVSGYLDSIHFKDGAEVKEGDLLFTIDQKPYQADLNAARAVRQSAETRLEQAKTDLQRAETLHSTKAVSEEEYDTRINSEREAEAALRAAQAAEDSAKLNLDYTQIKSPISGKVSQRMMTVGNLVQAQGGMASMLTTVVSMDPIYCYFTADERAYLTYRKNDVGSPSGQSIPCELGLENETSFPHKGHVDFFDNQVDSNTGTIRVRAVFENPDHTLVPGLFARVRVPAGPPVDALLVSDVAVSSDQGHKFVYVVNNEGVAEVRPVQVARQGSGFWQITSGLTTNDNVIVNGLLMVQPGRKVVATDPNAAPAPTAAH